MGRFMTSTVTFYTISILLLISKINNFLGPFAEIHGG